MLICPQCGNADLYVEVGGVLGDKYHCKKCTYIGNFVIEGEEDMIDEIKEGHLTEIGKYD